MLGTLASIGKNQGLNILLNMFFNPIINSAMAIASQINGVINQLINNLYLATRPQITKYYASGQLETMWRLTYTSSKIAFYILMTLSLPLFLEIKYILNIWLSDVPLQTEIFTRFLIVNLLIESSYNQLIAGLQAANKLKKIQLYDSTLLLSLIPLSFWGLKIFPNTMLPMCLMTLLSTLRIATYLYINKIELDLSIKNYIKKVLSKELIVLIIISIPISSLHYILSPGIFRLAYVSIATIILSAITIWSVGLENSEKDLLFNLLKKND
jgi:O-antigen/teichoic acid export membrane protein